MIEKRSFEVKLMVIGLSKSVLRQLPIREPSRTDIESGSTEMVCWMNGQAIGDRGSQPYVLCEDDTGPFLWRVWHYGRDGNDMVIAGKRIPFAVVK